MKLGGVTLVARRTPGHTRGCTTWTWRVADGGKGYDVVVIGSPNVNPGYRLVGNADYPEIADDFARTFEVLEGAAVRRLPRRPRRLLRHGREVRARQAGGRGEPVRGPRGLPRLRRPEGEGVPRRPGRAEGDEAADVDEPVAGEVRVEGHPEQPQLPVGVDGDAEERFGQHAPPLTTRREPVCSQTKTRPSGATSIAVAPLTPVATRTRRNHAGSATGPTTPPPGVPWSADRRLARYAARSANSAGDRAAASPPGISDALSATNPSTSDRRNVRLRPSASTSVSLASDSPWNDAREDPAVGKGKGDLAVALDDLAGRFEHRLDELLAVELPAEVGEVAADLPPSPRPAVSGLRPSRGGRRTEPEPPPPVLFTARSA